MHLPETYSDMFSRKAQAVVTSSIGAQGIADEEAGRRNNHRRNDGGMRVHAHQDETDYGAEQSRAECAAQQHRR